jgi:hypothetical protein
MRGKPRIKALLTNIFLEIIEMFNQHRSIKGRRITAFSGGRKRRIDAVFSII